MNPEVAVREYRGLVIRAVNQHLNRNRRLLSLREDFIQEGLLGLVLAARKWVPAKGKFATYAWYWVEQRLRLAVLEWFGSTTGRNNEGYRLPETFRREEVADVGDIRQEAPGLRPDRAVELQELADQLHRRLRRINRRSREIFTARLELDCRNTRARKAGASKEDRAEGTYDVLGKKFGVSRQAAKQFEQQVSEQIRRWGARIQKEAA